MHSRLTYGDLRCAKAPLRFPLNPLNFPSVPGANLFEARDQGGQPLPNNARTARQK